MGCRIWKPVAEALVSRGKRRVLAYDLFGRGYSDAAYPCDLSLFTGEVHEKKGRTCDALFSWLLT